jgi:hypothetical protein
MDPKIKPKICINTNCFQQTFKGKECLSCLTNKKKAKKQLQVLKYQKNSTSKKGNTLKVVIPENPVKIIYTKGLILWSKVIRGNKEYCYCETCGKMLKTYNGVYGAQAGHFLDKAIYWKLALNPDNGLIQCKECNVDMTHIFEEHKLIRQKIRQAMIENKGLEVIIDLEEQAEQFKYKVSTNQENSKPKIDDIPFLQNQITILKTLLT